MGAFGRNPDSGRLITRVVIALAVAIATVVAPVGGLPQARADFTDLPDQTWGVIDRGRSITTSTPAEVMAIAQIGNTIYAGGQFRTVVKRRAVDPHFSQPFLAAFDATTGDWIDWWRPQFDGPVFSLEAAADGSRLYVGGEFTEVNGHPGTAGIVALDPASGRIDPTWTPHIENAFSADPAAVRTIKESEGWLYIGGAMSHATGNSSSSRTRLWKVGRLSLTTGAPDSNWRPVVKEGAVWGLDHDPVRDRVYLAGYFETVNDLSPTDKFAVVTDTDGSTITGLERFPELTPTQDHQFEVIAQGDYVWVAGTQHLVQMLNANDLSINRRWFTGFEDDFHIGGDFQSLGIVGDAMYATCHCWGVLRELPNWVTELSDADDIQPLTDEIQGIMGFDLATGDYITGWDPDILGQIGGWAVHGAPDGCIWSGGDYNRRAIGDQWRNGLVRWCDDAGQGPPAGPPLTQQPLPETNAPAVVGAVTATDNGDGSADISWTASTDDTAVAYYRVYRDGFMIRATKSLTLTDLTPIPGDSYTVRAVDPYDNESGDSNSATPNLAGLVQPFVNDGFDGNDGGFVFVDDTFNGTSEPAFADGKVRRDGGEPDGSLMVILGGIDNDDFGGFSGAFEKTFTTPSSGPVEIQLSYKLDVKDSFESNEYGQAIVAVDGVRLGSGGVLEQINGGGNSGWVTYTTTMVIGAGSHTLELGAYQNEKTQISEFVEVSYDNVSITSRAPAVGFTSPAPGGEVSGNAAFELRASSVDDPSSALDVDVSTDGGNNWTAASWNATSQRFDFTYDVTVEPDGPLTLEARVEDTSARTGTGSATYTVNNDEDPSIAITNPTQGSNVTGVVTVRVTATDNDPVGTLDVEVSTNGATWSNASWNGSEYSINWNTDVNGDGPATVRARVTDSGGTTVNATQVNVTVGSPVGYSDSILSSGAVSYWRLGEGAGTTAADATGDHDGTYVGNPGLGAAALISDSNSSVNFDGTNDIVTVPDSTHLNLGGPHETKTLEAWFKADDVSARQVIYEQGATTRGINLYVRNGSVYAGAWNRTSHAGDSSTPWASDLFISAPINPGVTYHVVSVFDYPSDTFSLYVNGTLAASTSGLGRLYAHGGDIGLGAMRGSSRFDNGGKGGGDDHFFDGVIDEVATYNTALAAGTVATHYTIGGPEIDYAATVAADAAGVHWRLGELSGTNAADALIGNDATYTGGPGLGAAGVIVDSDKAVSFDGSNDMVDVPDSSDVNIGGPYDTWSMELWFNADNVTNRAVLFEQGATSRGLNMYVMNGRLYAGAWNVTLNGHPSQPWGPVFASTPISTGTVYHAVLVFDYPSDSLKLYLNGALADSASGLGRIASHGGDSAIGAMNDSTRFHDGGKAGGDNWYFDGVIDEVALYRAPLSSSVVANHYTVGLL